LAFVCFCLKALLFFFPMILCGWLLTGPAVIITITTLYVLRRTPLIFLLYPLVLACDYRQRNNQLSFFFCHSLSSTRHRRITITNNNTDHWPQQQVQWALMCIAVEPFSLLA
jgi:hypothetical protein